MALSMADILAAPEGMNQQVKPWQIPDGQARYLQDVVLDKEAEINRRGPVKPIATYPTFTDKAIGLVATDDPSYRWRVAVLHGDNDEARISPLNTSYTSATELDWDFGNSGLAFDQAKRYRVASSSHPRGGAIIGIQNFQSQKGQTSVGHWAGSAKAGFTGSGLTVAQDATSVTATGSPAWLSNVEPGMFLFAICNIATGSGKNYIGTVKEVVNDTTLTLVDGALFAVTDRNYTFRSVRPLDRRVAKGTITCATNSTTVNGANTKFKRQMGPPSGTEKWALFRADDMKYLGWVSTTPSDIQLTLDSNANEACNKDKFVAINMKGDLTMQNADARDFGWLTAQFAGRMWYGNNPYSNKAQPMSASRVWFSDSIDPEALDHTADGDHLFIPSTDPPVRPITAMIGLPTVLVVFKENETYGVYGTDESNFSVHRIDVDDGALSPMCIQRYEDGVVFAGQKGVWFFDGQEVYNILTDRMEDWYEKAMEGSNARTYGAWSMLYKGNYILYVDQASPPSGPDKTQNTSGVAGGTPQDHITMCINLPRRAVSLMTNLAFVGSVQSPMEENQGTLYLVNKVDDSTFALQGARICKASDLFDTDGLDTITTDLLNNYADQLGPDFYWESKRYDLGAPQQKKRYKQLQMLYWLETISGNFVANGHDQAAGTTDYTTNYLNFATLVSLNELSVTSASKWNPTRVRDTINDEWRTGYQNKRIKFNKRSQHIGWKVWQSNKTGIKKLRIGPLALGVKNMRPGRV